MGNHHDNFFPFSDLLKQIFIYPRPIIKLLELHFSAELLINFKLTLKPRLVFVVNLQECCSRIWEFKIYVVNINFTVWEEEQQRCQITGPVCIFRNHERTLLYSHSLQSIPLKEKVLLIGFLQMEINRVDPGVPRKPPPPLYSSSKWKMIRIPIISRLTLSDYWHLLITFGLLFLEWFVRLLARIVPMKSLKGTGKFGGSGGGKRKKDMREMVEAFGFGVEEHLVITTDGFILGIQRILPSPLKEKSSNGITNGIPPSPSSTSLSIHKRPPVLMLAGCMLNSEIWFCQEALDDNLPLHLTLLGYDVWCMNRRGSKYSSKHLSKTVNEEAYWDYCLDDSVLYDLPAVIQRVLEVTGFKNLTLIGFSQGSAEIMAYLSIHPSVKFVNLAICLGVMTKPMGMRHATIRSLVHLAPQLIFLLFGRKAMLASVPFWISTLSPEVYARMIRRCLWELFGWRCHNIENEQQSRMFPHMYTYCSVKTIVHWFQMMRAGHFRMYNNGRDDLGLVVPRYPLESITTPVVVFYGSEDTLCDPQYTRQHLGEGMVAEHCIEGYEHLDFLFAHDLSQRVFPLLTSELQKLKRKSTKSH